MFDATILSVLQKAATSAVAASTVPDLPIKYVDGGVTFEVPNDHKYLELVFIPNSRSDFWGTEKNYAGLWRMILHWPKDGKAAYEPMGHLASIAEYFSKDRQFASGVRITSGPDALQPLPLGPEILYPANCRYECFRP